MTQAMTTHSAVSSFSVIRKRFARFRSALPVVWWSDSPPEGPSDACLPWSRVAERLWQKRCYADQPLHFPALLQLWVVPQLPGTRFFLDLICIHELSHLICKLVAFLHQWHRCDWPVLCTRIVAGQTTEIVASHTPYVYKCAPIHPSDKPVVPNFFPRNTARLF